MPDRIRFVMIGGFLGAGKTTLLAQLARHYQAQGKHVCIVTNDQAADLVDTHLLKSYGYDVEEVAGSCFCCNFDGLTDAMQSFETRQRPDIILAEPVGSCTDLMATVALPMMDLLGEKFEIAPYAVVLKPSHGLKILSGTGKGFSPKAEYIFRKQLEEADVLLINRIDELPASTVDVLDRLLTDQYSGPGKDQPTVLRISAKTGENMDALVAALSGSTTRHRQLMEVDYDVYAEGEAELGWLNATVQVISTTAFDLDRLLLDVIEALKQQLIAMHVEPAHLKAIGQSEGQAAAVNLVSSDTPVALSLPSECLVTHADMVINVRVATTPESLEHAVRAALDATAERLGVTIALRSLQSFRPGRPVPTHRVAP